MSYDLRIRVKAEGCDKYPVIAIPDYSNPTYNLRKMLVACMGWEYQQCEQDDTNGKWNTVYYRCDEVIPKIEHGIDELKNRKDFYEQYNPCSWGNVDNAIEALESLRKCIYEQAEEIPLNCLYMSW
jgi:hypothetical protein